LEEAEELFNCTITFDGIDYGALGEWYLTRLMAGDSKYDFWNVQNVISYYPLVTADALFAYDALVGEDYFEGITEFDSYVIDQMKFKGKNYVFSATYAYEPMDYLLSGSYLMFYNKTMLENEAIEDPQELYYAGEWDWDALDVMVNQLTKDLDGDGENDQWGCTKITNWLAESFVRSNGVKYAEEDENGNLKYTIGTKYAEEAEAALNQLQEWNLVDKVWTPEWNALNALQSGTCGFALYLWGLWNYETVLDNCDFEVGLVPLPKGDNADRIMIPAHGFGGMALPANVAQPEAMLALWEFLYNDSTEVREEQFEMDLSKFRSRENAELVLSLTELWEGEIKVMYVGELGIPEVWQGNRQVIDDVIFGRKTFSESVNSLLPVMQGYLDDTFND